MLFSYAENQRLKPSGFIESLTLIEPKGSKRDFEGGRRGFKFVRGGMGGFKEGGWVGLRNGWRKRE